MAPTKKILTVIWPAMALLLCPAGRAFADFTVNNGAVTFGNNEEYRTSTMTIGTGGTLGAGGANISVTGNWLNSGVFNADASTVAFENGAATSTIAGNNAFYTFACSSAGKNIVFTAGSTQTVTGTFSVLGAPGNPVKLRSSNDAVRWYIGFPNGPQTVSYVDVKDSGALYNSVRAPNSADSGNNNANWLWRIPLLLSPPGGAVGISQSPSFSAAELLFGASEQYHFQVDTLPTMDSQGGSPQDSFDQAAAQLFASSGAFSGQDTAISVANDAYSAISTATFAFYSVSAKLSANTQYYWRARVKPAGGSYGVWSGTASFTTGRFAAQSPVNHLVISGVNLFGATSAGLVSVGFDIAENNVTTGTSSGGGAYNTADWIFVKFSTQAGADGSWNHATLTGGVVGAGAALTAASDSKGVFLDHTANSAYWTAGATVTWNFGMDNVVLSKVRVKVFAVSMVRVPLGSFVYNAGNAGGSTFNNYGNNAQATVTGPGVALGTGLNDLPLNAPVGWPNGYNSFYMGRYEITQGQYADFLNTIPSGSAATRYEPTVAYGHNMTNAGVYPNKYAAVDPNAAKNYLSYADAWSYFSWSGLRPPTEMEFEKAGRDISGGSDARVYPWGNSAPDLVTYTPPNETGTCIRRYLNYNNTVGCTKVLDVGRYMSGDVYRTAQETGASPWGIADLAGNVWEFIINSSWLSVPLNGDGTLNLPGSWPVPGAATAGLRGGGWYSNATLDRVSARDNASWAYTVRSNGIGARAARTP